jgi:hypothetical protein
MVQCTRVWISGVNSMMPNSSSQSDVSIQGIARSAGIPHSTISPALADSPLVTLQAKQVMEFIAREVEHIHEASVCVPANRYTATIGLDTTIPSLYPLSRVGHREKHTRQGLQWHSLRSQQRGVASISGALQLDNA